MHQYQPFTACASLSLSSSKRSLQVAGSRLTDLIIVDLIIVDLSQARLFDRTLIITRSISLDLDPYTVGSVSVP